MNGNKDHVNPLRGHKKGESKNLDEDQQQKCIICSDKLKVVHKFFAQCDHQGTCVGCAQATMIQQIQAGKYPKCFIKQGCNAKIITNEHSLFNYFTDHGKKTLLQFKIRQPSAELKRLSIKHCKKPDCKGIINFDRCTKCCTYYCQLCGELDHQYGVSCNQSTLFSIQSLKKCPKCEQNYVRDEGCIHVVCPKCKFSFCEVCHDEWNRLHHACNLKNFSAPQPIINNTDSRKKSPKKTQSCCQIF